MADLIQFKRGPSSNTGRSKLRQGEPGFEYDTKRILIGIDENKSPIVFFNAQDITYLVNNTQATLEYAITSSKQELLNLLNTLEDDTQIVFHAHEERIDALTDIQNTHSSQISALEYNTSQKIKSERLSTAADADKIGLANLRQEIIAYINQNSGSTGGGGSAPQIIPGSIGFDLLATEVNASINNGDYGDY